MEVKDVTNVLFIRDNYVLLGMKKRGFGVNKYNGFGGKLKKGESIEQAALREAEEESGLIPRIYEKRAIIDFPHSYPLRMNVYVCTEWEGELKESDEMRPQWFRIDDIPYHLMWEDDVYWLQHVLMGKSLRASFIFAHGDDIDGTANNRIVEHHLEFVESLDNVAK